MDRDDTDRPTSEAAADARPRWWSEAGGACGDLGTFVPLVVGAIAVAGVSAAGVLFGFGALLIASGLFYGLPMAVQPMKAVAALLATGDLAPGAMAAAGALVGVVLIVLAITGAIERLARLIPWSVNAGLQLGLGLSLAIIGLRLAAETPWLGIAVGAGLLLLLAARMGPAAPLVVLAATAAGHQTGLTVWPDGLAPMLTLPPLVLPSWSDLWEGFHRAAIPQLPLTLTNAVIVTAVLTRDLYPGRAARASERNLAFSTGIGNLLLAPFGAMPMCHGAGGVQAHHRYGARTGFAPVALGALMLGLSLGFADGAAAALAAIPTAAVGAMLAVAGADLAISRRLFDARRSCWPAIGVTAATTLLIDPAIGLLAGVAVEGLRSRAANALRRRES